MLIGISSSALCKYVRDTLRSCRRVSFPGSVGECELQNRGKGLGDWMGQGDEGWEPGQEGGLKSVIRAWGGNIKGP